VLLYHRNSYRHSTKKAALSFNVLFHLFYFILGYTDNLFSGGGDPLLFATYIYISFLLYNSIYRFQNLPLRRSAIYLSLFIVTVSGGVDFSFFSIFYPYTPFLPFFAVLVFSPICQKESIHNTKPTTKNDDFSSKCLVLRKNDFHKDLLLVAL